MGQIGRPESVLSLVPCPVPRYGIARPPPAADVARIVGQRASTRSTSRLSRSASSMIAGISAARARAPIFPALIAPRRAACADLPHGYRVS